MALQTLTAGASSTAKTITVQTVANQIGYTVPAGRQFKGSVRAGATGCSLYINGVVVNSMLPYAYNDPQFFIELNAGDSIVTSAVAYIIGVES